MLLTCFAQILIGGKILATDKELLIDIIKHEGNCLTYDSVCVECAKCPIRNKKGITSLCNEYPSRKNRYNAACKKYAELYGSSELMELLL